MQTIVIRHKKENLAKCSLRGLEGRSDMLFFRYPFTELPPLKGYLMLVMEGAPELSEKDHDAGLLLLDSTWRYLPRMVDAVEKQELVEKRVLPGGFLTAYPRRQDDCVDPTRGLSTVEALYLAYRLMGRSTEGIFDHYHWGKKFLEINHLA